MGRLLSITRRKLACPMMTNSCAACTPGLNVDKTDQESLSSEYHHRGGPMAITREISRAALADIEKFEEQLARYLAGELEDDVFRVFRLNNGIYGQRQGGHNQMVRVKLPYGNVTPEQLEMLGSIADRYSRGWGHLTTRQNVQFHFVQLERVPDLLRDLASVALTTREA